jgi:hypothetical protein
MKYRQKLYAIVNRNTWKYRSDLRCPTLEGQLPIFWNKKVAKRYLLEKNLVDLYEIKVVNLREE